LAAALARCFEHFGAMRNHHGELLRLNDETSPAPWFREYFPLATSAIAPLRARAESEGYGDFSPLWSGQNASGCKEVPAAQLTRELAANL
jgi:nitronate monooxygenase